MAAPPSCLWAALVSVAQGTKGGFAEIVQRSQGRFEMVHEMDKGVFDTSRPRPGPSP